MKKITCLLLLTVFINSATALAAPPAKKLERPETLVPMGQTAGVQLTARGLIVTGYTETDDKGGCPARQGGLQPGDLVTHINGETVSGAQCFQDIIQSSGGNVLEFTVARKNASVTLSITPVLCTEDNAYKVGAWVRDNVSGIGTLTFYDPQSHVFGALGHGINDSGTKSLLPLDSGILLSAQVADVRKGLPGYPGELKGVFATESSGSLLLNSRNGLFGVCERPEIYEMGSALPLAKNNEVKVGDAQILANVKDKKVERFEIEIVRILDVSGSDSRSFMIKVTDPALIAKTGGIVQGMSGSPIIQEGKLVGAVTHVLVSDPKKGYGIFIDNMLDEVYGTAELFLTYLFV